LPGLRFAAITLICLSAARANTCTPFNAPAVVVQGQTFQPAIVNGIDNVSYSTVRFQWTSDAATTNINFQRLVYATHAQWLANGNRIVAGTAGVNYSIAELGLYAANQNDTIQGLVATNLLDNTQYHIAGQSSPDGGVTFCPVVEETFTTLPYAGIVPPTPPATFNPAVPSVTGTDYTLGVAPCTDLQTCLNLALPGDGIGIPPGLPASSRVPFTLPNNPKAIAISGINVAASTFTAAAHGLTNGTKIHIGVDSYFSPSPINKGETYSVLNATANTFQISLDGTNPLVLNDAGLGNIYVVRWPISQNYVLIHSTAGASALPPNGVRLDPVAYRSALGKIQLAVPTTNAGSGVVLLLQKALNSFYYFKDIEFDTLPNALTTQTDPVPYYELFYTSSQSDHIVFDQCYFHPAPAPDRVFLAGQWGGTNQAIINSYFDNIDYWRPTRTGPGSSVGSTTITIPALTFNYPTAGNTKVTCTVPSPTTMTFSGTAGAFYVYFTIGPCALTVNATAGTTVSGTGFTVVNSASPSYPVDGSSVSTVLQIGQGNWNGATVNFADTGCIYGQCFSWGGTESAVGIYFTDGPGPFNFSNNYFAGEGIIGPYKDEYIGTTCLSRPVCSPTSNIINLTVARNNIEWDKKYIITSPTWNGGWWFGRNANEFKQGSRIVLDGNIIGPSYGGVSHGECMDLFTYHGGDPQNRPNVQATDDIQFTNNTCYFTGSGLTIGSTVPGGVATPKPMQRLLISNNVFLNNDNFSQNPAPTVATAQGRGILIDGIESATISHNTWYYQAGLTNGCVYQAIKLSAGVNISNNICNYNADPASQPAFSYSTFGGSNVPYPNPGALTQGSALLAYLNHATWSGNVVLCQWSNSNPASRVEITNAACAANSSLYPASPATYFPNSGSTLASRVSAIHWFDPANANFRLNYQSPYISGARASSDGLDIGADMNALEAAQGKVTNVHTYGTTTTATTVAFTAPDTTGCSVDYGTVNFPSGTGGWTRVPNTGGQRAQTVALAGLASQTTYTYRVNCAVMQPTGTFATQ